MSFIKWENTNTLSSSAYRVIVKSNHPTDLNWAGQVVGCGGGEEPRCVSLWLHIHKLSQTEIF